MADKHPDEFFRAGVGAVVANGSGAVLAGERRESPGSWQLPQGGIDPGDTPVDAAYRELYEELGLERTDVELIGEHPGWVTYELEAPTEKHGRGQTQKYFWFRLVAPDERVDLERFARETKTEPEFSSWRWIDLETLASMTWAVRAPIYRALAGAAPTRLASDSADIGRRHLSIRDIP